MSANSESIVARWHCAVNSASALLFAGRRFEEIPIFISCSAPTAIKCQHKDGRKSGKYRELLI